MTDECGISKDSKEEFLIERVSKDIYFSWLHEVTNLHPLLYDYGWIRLPLDLNTEIIPDLQALKYLYLMVKSYSFLNKISPFTNLDNEYYLIRFHNDFYKLYQIEVNFGIVTFCQRLCLDLTPQFFEEEFLDIQAIINFFKTEPEIIKKMVLKDKKK